MIRERSTAAESGQRIERTGGVVRSTGRDSMIVSSDLDAARARDRSFTVDVREASRPIRERLGVPIATVRA